MYVSKGVLEQRDLRPVSHREYFHFLQKLLIFNDDESNLKIRHSSIFNNHR